ncbi:hypothetical protein [Kineosporia babensis]|uniref:Uncharacterized protein n=1 Tax=Kineosporia babensis TaxID=499548 RepID=A0A9X1NIL2_9ACTN|nr:hypothetical protein [Kineosporia babensis]MCD5314254.1 hypothetical protein [Kineosporia babensis]
MPLVHNGQEYFLPENDHDTGLQVTPRPLRWKIAGGWTGRTLTALHGAPARIRTRMASAW